MENKHCSPDTSHSFFEHPERQASPRTSNKSRRSSQASHPTSLSTTSQCLPFSTTSQPPHHHSPPPMAVLYRVPHLPRHRGPPSPPMTRIWHLLQDQGRELASLKQCLGAPPPLCCHWGQIIPLAAGSGMLGVLCRLKRKCDFSNKSSYSVLV